MTAVEESGQQPADVAARARLAADLRSAYEDGARVKDLAVASHRAQSEVRRLLREAGVVLGGAPRRRPGRVRAAAPPTGKTSGEAAGGGRAGAAGAGAAVSGGSVPGRSATVERQRLRARVVRVGADTSFVVLPEWRPAIAVPVATTVLLAATGLPREGLRGAELSAVVDPGAVHDRDLAPEGWRPDGSASGQAGPAGPTDSAAHDVTGTGADGTEAAGAECAEAGTG
ncbi:helix-turn-helix domain-containing protein [Streptomyces sp. NPDC001380]|uniref:helix-turn-helix domain-containing protein n=1 Tax=Streptomyces sp. NPDC001380 TaxID=3364566 RepID=UPI003689E537